MLHWTADRFTPANDCAVEFPLIVPAERAQATPSRRAEHARMLAHAATRRLRASGGEERAYWRACAPAAVARATRLRGEGGLARLP